MPELRKSEEYAVTVTEVTDGDTVTVEFDDGMVEDVRVLGIDTPEKQEFQRFERTEEWVGIDGLPTLAEWADRATEYARDLLNGEGTTVTLSFDASAPIRDQFDRLLGYIDRDGFTFNRMMVEAGFARCYHSGFADHDAYAAAERRARERGLGLWAESDPENTPEIRNREVRRLYVPNPASVGTVDGQPDDDRVPVYASPSAFHPGAWNDGGHIPLAAVERRANVAMVGGPLIEETYEESEGYDVPTDGFDNFAFLSNLLDSLGANDGDVVVDGGHGQFEAQDYGLSLEDTAYYRRYLEGVGVTMRQVNTLTAERLNGHRAVIVTTPDRPFTDDEIAALREFRDDGGAVILSGTTTGPVETKMRLNRVAADLGSDLRLNDDRVMDFNDNLNDDPTVVTTSLFNRSFDLFGPFDP